MVRGEEGGEKGGKRKGERVEGGKGWGELECGGGVARN